jgi:hypothetical protein
MHEEEKDLKTCPKLPNNCIAFLLYTWAFLGLGDLVVTLKEQGSAGEGQRCMELAPPLLAWWSQAKCFTLCTSVYSSVMWG